MIELMEDGLNSVQLIPRMELNHSDEPGFKGIHKTGT